MYGLPNKKIQKTKVIFSITLRLCLDKLEKTVNLAADVF